MKTTRLLATSATAVVLALGLTACGSDDGAPATSSASPSDAGTPSSSAPSSPAPSSAASASVDDGPVTDEALRSELERIALDEVGRGRVTEVETSDDPDHAYEVEVDLGNDDDVTVEIAEDRSVVRVDR